MIDIKVKIWDCGCIQTSNGSLMATVYNTSECTRHPDQCDEQKDFWGGKIPDFEMKLAAEYDDEV